MSRISCSKPKLVCKPFGLHTTTTTTTYYYCYYILLQLLQTTTTTTYYNSYYIPLKDLCVVCTAPKHTRTAAHTAQLSNVITVWTSVVLHEFYKCLVHKSQVTLCQVSGRRIAFWTLVACNRKQQNRAYDFSLIS